MKKPTEVSRRSVTKDNNSPLVIYISESDNHRDMSQSSLAKQLIEQCEKRNLSVKVFSEFKSQTCKVGAASCSTYDEWKGAIEGNFTVGVPTQLEKLKNVPSEKVHIETTKFLDSRFIPMDDLAYRNFERNQETWSELPQVVKDGSSKNLLDHFVKMGAIDHPSTLQDMIDDVEKGEKIPRDWVNGEGKKPVDDTKAYYDFWANCLNYKSTHEKMAQDVRTNLAEQPTPDVIIMIAGDPHIFGLDQQLPELKDSRRIITGGERIDRIEGIDRMVFSVDSHTKEAIIPEELTEAINARSWSKELQTSKSESLTIAQEEVVSKQDNIIKVTIDALDLATRLPSETKKSSIADHLDIAGTSKRDKSWVSRTASEYEKKSNGSQGKV
jgi:hypothetical protein